MRTAGSQPAFKTGINHEPRIDRVSQRPKGRDETWRGAVELRVPVEFSGEPQTAANRAGERQIELIVLIEARRTLAADPKMRSVEIEMNTTMSLLARKVKE